MENRQQPIKKYVWACAWCELKEITPLEEGQVYTHGICEQHKRQMLDRELSLHSLSR